jgi:hypothetical protein
MSSGHNLFGDGDLFGVGDEGWEDHVGQSPLQGAKGFRVCCRRQRGVVVGRLWRLGGNALA